MIEIIPGIQEDAFPKIETKIQLVESQVDWVQIDVTDNTLTENESYRDPRPFKDLQTRLNFEAHLMVKDPVSIAKEWVDAGFRRLIAHVECENPQGFIDATKELEVEVGLALDGPTNVVEIVPYLDELDQVLVMMYKAGPSGQKFQVENLEKIKFLHRSWPNVPIEVDGGINQETASYVKKAGATRLVSTSFIFWQNQDIGAAIEALRNA